LAVLAPGNNVMRYERTAVNDGGQPTHHQHRHRHHHHRPHHHHSYQQLQQQTDVLQSSAVDRFYGESSGQRDSAFVRLSQSAESHEMRHQQAITKVSETSASFEAAATSSRTTKTADVQASSRHFATRNLEISERRVVNGFRPISSAKQPVVLAPNRQQVEVPFVHLTAKASAPSEVRMQPQQRPAIAVIQLSSSVVDDKIVYHEPPNGRKRQEMPDTGNNVAPPPPPPPSPTSKRQTPDVLGNGQRQVPVVLPHRADMQAVVNRLSARDSWKRRKANKLAKRRTAAEEVQRCRQT